MHTCACAIVQGDVSYCSVAHARADAAAALSGNQHTFYRAYWRRFRTAAQAEPRRGSKPLPPLPEGYMHYPHPAPQPLPTPTPTPPTRPQLQRMPEFMRPLPEPPSCFSATTVATSRSKYLPDPPSHFSSTTAATSRSCYPEPRSHFSATTIGTAFALHDSASFPLPPLPPLPERAHAHPARLSDVMSVTSICTTPELDEGEFVPLGERGGGSESETESESEEEGEPPGSPTLTRVSDWLGQADEKLAKLRMSSAPLAAAAKLGHDLDETMTAPTNTITKTTTPSGTEPTNNPSLENGAADLPPPPPPKPKLMHRECTIYLPVPAPSVRASTATARARVYDDLRTHSIFRAYFDGPAMEGQAQGQPETPSRAGSVRLALARKASARRADAGAVPPVPAIPAQYRAHAARPSLALSLSTHRAEPHVPAKDAGAAAAPSIHGEGEGQARVLAVRTDAIRPLRIHKLAHAPVAPPTPPKEKPRALPSPPRASAEEEAPPVPQKEPSGAGNALKSAKRAELDLAGRAAVDEQEQAQERMSPREYRDSLAAETGWWAETPRERGRAGREGEGAGMSLSFLEADPYPMGVWN